MSCTSGSAAQSRPAPSPWPWHDGLAREVRSYALAVATYGPDSRLSAVTATDTYRDSGVPGWLAEGRSLLRAIWREWSAGEGEHGITLDGYSAPADVPLSTCAVCRLLPLGPRTAGAAERAVASADNRELRRMFPEALAEVMNTSWREPCCASSAVAASLMRAAYRAQLAGEGE